MGAKKFDMSLETREIKLFGGTSQDFAGIFRKCPKTLREKRVVFNFWPLKFELSTAGGLCDISWLSLLVVCGIGHFGVSNVSSQVEDAVV